MPAPTADFVARKGRTPALFPVRAELPMPVLGVIQPCPPARGSAPWRSIRATPDPADGEYRFPGILTVYDLAGHRVCRQDLGPLTAGTHHTRWDGRNTAELNVSSGLYVLQLETSSGESQSIKGLLVRWCYLGSAYRESTRKGSPTGVPRH